MGCEYCLEDKFLLKDKRFGIEQHVFIDRGYLYSIAVSDEAPYRSATEKLEINYCPMCGRKLGDAR